MSRTAFHAQRRRLCLGAVALATALATPIAALAQQPAPTLAPADARSRAAAGEIRLIDVRTPEEWRETGVAPGAVRINLYHPDGPDGFKREILKLVKNDRNTPIALICRSGNRSGQAQRFLAEQGFTRVYDVSEGMSGGRNGPGWIGRGLPVEPCKSC